MVLSLFLCITPLITNPSPKYFIAVGSIALAFIIYFFIIYKKYQPKCMGKDSKVRFVVSFVKIFSFAEKFSYFVQVLLEVSVPESEFQLSPVVSLEEAAKKQE